VLDGLMQHQPLTLQLILERARRIYADGEVATLTEAGTVRATYAEVAERVDRLCSALRDLGVRPGDRVASFAWNSQRHLELYLAVPCMGAVLHTLNIRLFPDQLTYIANHAEDQVVFVDDSLVGVLEQVAPTFETVEHYVVMGDGDAGSLPDPLRYEDLIAAQEPGFDYPDLDEDAACGACYTSGTTGNPKGVLYSHRSSMLHAMSKCMAETEALSSADRVLPVVPQFHANAWGFPYACLLTGADLVMPGPFLQGDALAKLIAEERVTVAGGVPTIWMDLLRHAEDNPVDFSSLRMLVCGGSAVPLSLMQAWEERHGVPMLQAWGMTETSPLAALARPPRSAGGDEDWHYRSKTGRVIPLVDVRLVDGTGAEVPWDGESTGEIQVRGPWIAADYYRDPDSGEKFDGEWLRTGDIASIDRHGFLQISDRAKDVIKSGGEWISSVELENHLMAHRDVVEAAVIAMPDDRWSERPLACVVRRGGSDLGAEDLRAHLEPQVAKWWLPDAYAFVDEVPKTSVGKFDKKVLRQRLADGELEVEQASKPVSQPA
jgi:fatty-acyl-CoA synthase